MVASSHFDRYDAELVRLRQLVARKREHFPDLELEEVVRLAVEEFNNPEFESDPAYRTFLLERVADGGLSDQS